MKDVLFFFGQLSDGDVEWMMKFGYRVVANAGLNLIQKGEPIEALYIVLDGELVVLTGSESEVARLGRGEVAGEMSFIDARPPSATVRSVDNSILFAIKRSVLESKLEEDFEFAARFYKSMAIFLSARIRSVMGEQGDEDEDFDEIDPNALEGLSRAGDRFDRLMSRFYSPTMASI